MKKKYKRYLQCFIAVVLMGFATSWLILTGQGTDPCTCCNLGISGKLGISFGNWMLIFNLGLFVITFCMGRNYIGVGTILNMVMVGYSCDFFTEVWNKLGITWWADSFVGEIILIVLMLLIFVLAASVYMNCGIGVAPYDAVSMIIHKAFQDKMSFRAVRIMYDVVAVVIGAMLGSAVGIVTVLMALALGPAVDFVKKKMNFSDRS